MNKTNFIESFADSALRWHRDITLPLNKNGNYPPYNIRKIDEGKYSIELALAGVSIGDIDIELNSNKLSIKYNGAPEVADNYIVHGIANRAFERTFELMNGIEVTTAESINGILTIYLNALSVEKKPVKINISQPKASETQLLNEDSVI